MTPKPARFATVATPPGPFTVVVGPGPDGRDVVLASGWTDDVSALLPVVHRSLRPTWVEEAEYLPVLDTVTAFFDGDVLAIDDVPVHQRSGPFLEDAWEVLRTVPAGEPDTYAVVRRPVRPARRRSGPPPTRAPGTRRRCSCPCHRVLGSDGGLGGFRWGTPVKRWLLDHEAAHAPAAVA